mmetsp:Transcript_29198/g.72755  ORF Transcript_29198/g.72755 Transcript_29198/m.72755 type:complete len:371 (-) Transcript_29198:1306-2418(-)
MGEMCEEEYMPPWNYTAPDVDFTPHLQKHRGFNGTCQVLLSGTRYFLKTPESVTVTSIMDDYDRLIREAERYVYLETQFYVGLPTSYIRCAKNSKDPKFHPKNKVPAAIFARVTNAMRDNEDFSFVLSVPIGPQPTMALYAVLMSLFGECGLVPCLERYRSENNIHEPLKKYFSVYFHGRVANLPSGSAGTVAYTTYVHSKMLLVDDRYAHVGSANCNDRSMTGEGDAQANVRFTAESAKRDTNGVLKLREKVFGYLFPYLKPDKNLDPFSTYKRSLSEMVADAVDTARASKTVAEATGLDWRRGTLHGKPLRTLEDWDKIAGGFKYIDLSGTIDEKALPLLWPLTADIWGEPAQWKRFLNSTKLSKVAW